MLVKLIEKFRKELALCYDFVHTEGSLNSSQESQNTNELLFPTVHNLNGHSYLSNDSS